MEKEFIPYEQALTLKELGFNELCFGYYTSFYKIDLIKEGGFKGCVNSALQENEIAAPLYQQAFRWFREKYEIESEISADFDRGFGYNRGYIPIIRYNKEVEKLYTGGDCYETYPEAELECLRKLIEICKK